MKDIALLILLIVESFLGSGRSERTFDEIAEEAICTAKCDSPGNRDECQRMCVENRLNVTTVLDVEAEANVRLVCRDEDNLALGFGPGVFIGEHREETGDWNSDEDVLIDGQLTATIREPSSRYQWRLTRALANGISRPEITDWITTLLPGVKPERVPKIWVQCLDQENGTSEEQAATVRAEIAFQPSEDRCCRYRVTCKQNQGTYARTTILNIGNIEKGKETPNIVFTNLEFGQSFTVIVEPRGSGIDGDTTVMNFSTPLSWKLGGPPRICVPDGVEGLDTSVVHAMKNTFDLHVTWFRPVWLPDFFMVKTTSRGAAGTEYRISHNVSGSATETIFRAVDISQQIDVSIRAWTMLGGGPDTSERSVTPQRTTSLKGTN